MRQLGLVCLLFLGAPAFSQAPATSQDVMTQESTFWANYTAGNTAALAAQLSPDFTSVQEWILNRERFFILLGINLRCPMAPVKLREPHVSLLTPDIATIVYQALLSRTCDGRTYREHINVSSVWHHRNGHWQMDLHTEYDHKLGGHGNMD